MHRIRLQAGWTVAAEADGRTRHTRSFGMPRLPDPAERVWLVCESIEQAADVLINGAQVGTAVIGRGWRADITAWLQRRNEIQIVIPGSGAVGEVALEIGKPE